MSFTTEKHSPFNTLAKALPLFSGLFIFLGTIKLIIRYRIFHIDIIPYLSLNDLVINFVSDMAYLFIIILVSVIPILFVTTFFGSFMVIQFKEIRKTGGWMIAGLVGIILSAIMLFNDNNNIWLWVSFTLLLSVTILYGFRYSLYYYVRQYFTEKKIREHLLPLTIYSAIFYLVLQVVITLHYYQNLRLGIDDRNTTLILKSGEIIKPKSQEFYIGNTQEYYFTYNFVKGEGRVIPKEDVEKALFHK